jgi:hypothetical protein
MWVSFDVMGRDCLAATEAGANFGRNAEPA